MGLYSNFPYSDFENLNLDWLIKNMKQLDSDTRREIQELTNLFYGDIQAQVNQYIQENLSQFLLGAMYIEDRTCIKLQQAEVIGDSDHVYNTQQESIVVLEGR